jgi:hypothetical protein
MSYRRPAFSRGQLPARSHEIRAPPRTIDGCGSKREVDPWRSLLRRAPLRFPDALFVERSILLLRRLWKFIAERKLNDAVRLV